MRLLWHVEPAMFRENPLSVKAWLGWIVQEIRASRAVGAPLKQGLVASQPACRHVNGAIPGGLDYQRPVLQREVLATARFNRFAHARDLFDNTCNFLTNDTLLSAFHEAARDFDPDVIISFSENRYFKEAFPRAALLFAEFAPYGRMFTRPALFLDPSGHQHTGLLARRLPEMLSGPVSHGTLAALKRLWGTHFEEPTRAHSSGQRLAEWLSEKAAGRKVVLFALQPTDWMTYEGAYETIPLSGLVMRWGAALPGGWAACVTCHPHQRLTTEAAGLIGEEFPNIFVAPPDLGAGVSELLLPHVDAVAAVSSSVGAQAALWGKPVAAYGESSLCGFGYWRLEDLDGAKGLNDTERLLLLRFLTHRYCHPLDRLQFEGGYLNGFLEQWRQAGWSHDFFFDQDAWDPEAAENLLRPAPPKAAAPAAPAPSPGGPHPARKTRVLLLNETGVLHHAGCLGVTDAHRRMIAARNAELSDEVDAFEVKRHFDRLFRAHPFKDEPEWFDRAANFLGGDDCLGPLIDRADAVAVNGEGSIHHGAGMPYLALLLAAHRKGRRTALVNALLQQVPDAARHPLSMLNDVTVREPLSAAEAKRLGRPARIVPDSALEAAFGGEAERDFGGMVVVGDAHWDGGAGLVEGVMQRLETPHAYWKISDFHDWRTVTASLRTASLFITARHHGVYLAALAGIPFVALPANTHKMEGLLQLMDHPHPVCRSVDEALDRCAELLDNPTRSGASRTRLLARRPLPTFDVLLGG